MANSVIAQYPSPSPPPFPGSWRLDDEDNEEVTRRALNLLKHLGAEEGCWDGAIEYLTGECAPGSSGSWDDTSHLTPVVTYKGLCGETRYLPTVPQRGRS